MNAPEERLRTRPSERFAGSEHLLDLPQQLAALRAEPSPVVDGHRQIALMHQGPVRLVLYVFEANGCLPQHAAPGWVTIHSLRGTINVRTPDNYHALREGQLLSLAPGILHDVEAPDGADMLLGIYPAATNTR